MRFFNQKNEINFEEFKDILPEEASLVQAHLDSPGDFELDSNALLHLRGEFCSPIRLDLDSQINYHKKFFYKNSVYNQPLAKALGIKKGKPRPRVLDATAGTLKDTMLILAMDCQVLACERSPFAQALIVNALKQTTNVSGLEFCAKAAQEIVKERLDYDTIYFDPMYEQKNDKAAPRKEMRIFREVISADLDAKDCANLLRETKKRLVIKRSSKAVPLLAGASMSFGQKSTIYDVYL
ncbi:MAG: class I SAM-dependent methyltransferase [Bacteriovoracaceae bacterium]|nr:class I SAM-dependent methyltransferase [Bacteriovoracaceae bacterium]